MDPEQRAVYNPLYGRGKQYEWESDVTAFQDRVMELIDAKRSNLSVGLDPGFPGQVDEDAIPQRYLGGNDPNKALVDYCLDIVDQVADAAVTIKITQPYVMSLGEEHHRAITDRIRARGALSIYDMKLGSIHRTAFAALWHVHRWGYDAVTLTPLLGDNQSVVQAAAQLDPPLASIVYVLSSAPAMARYVGQAKIDSTPLAEQVITDLGAYQPDGCLFGAGRCVSDELLSHARRTLGPRSPFVFVVGSDDRESQRLMRVSGHASLINVGRDIIYSDQPRNQAEAWVSKLRSFETA